MARVCVILVAGLDHALLARTPGLKVIGGMKHRASFQPVLPGVTCTMQATLTTGKSPAQHGIIANGLLTHNRPELHPHLDLTNHAEIRKEVSFWEQSNSLLDAPRFWEGTGKKVAMLFWQNSMPDPRGQHPAADIVITPKPVHTPDGKTMTACWSSPADLYSTLTAKIGPFPLHNYWSPMAGLPSSQWILKSAEHVWREHKPDLQLVYLPHMDFNLQRLGPSHPAVVKDLQDLDAALAPLAEMVRADGGELVIVGDYGMLEVTTVVRPNLALRDAGLLATKLDATGKLLIDHETTKTFALADHQIAHVYTKPEVREAARELLAKLPGVAQVLSTAEEIAAAGLNHARAGHLILIAKPDAWFAHDWWHSDEEKPRWQFTVDIHSKPGYDPRELFFDPVRKCIAQDAGLVKGSHGRADDAEKWPVLLSDRALPPQGFAATDIAGWLKGLLGE